MSLLRGVVVAVLDLIERDEEIGARVRAFLVAPTATPTHDADELLPLRRCGLPPTSASRAVREGDLRAHRIGRELLVRRGDLDAFLAARVVEPRKRSANVANDVHDGDEFDRALRARGGR